jgi:hypothetical protein
MKKVLLITLSIFSFNFIYCQDLPIDSKTGRITYTEVNKIDSLNKSELYSKTLEWFAYKFSSSNDVIQLKNEDKGKIIGKGNFGIKYYSRSPNIDFTITVLLKENRYKIIITDLNYQDNKGDQFPVANFPKYWAGKKKLYKTVDANVKAILIDFKNFMESPSQEDW